jgi:hypothetical protein
VSVLQILCDHWDGVFNREEIVETPTTADFDRLLDRMDGQIHTMIMLRRENDAHMGIGGGSGKYVVYAAFDNETFWNLIAPEREPGTVMLNAGGQEGEYPARQVVTQDRARQAGHTFLATGELDRSLRWEMQ